MTLGILYIVSTPIGNLGDMTNRAVETLKSVDIIFCEDTRVTGFLLEHFGVSTERRSYHQHSGEKVIENIYDLLGLGKNIALVTDAGTPGISDPGNELIAGLLARDPNIKIVPIPGPSALTAALSICGFPCERVTFAGFPPHKNKRKKFFEEIKQIEHTVVFYESSYRVLDALERLAELMPERKICVCRELTKKFETIYRGTIGVVQKNSIPEKGEFVLVLR